MKKLLIAAVIACSMALSPLILSVDAKTKNGEALEMRIKGVSVHPETNAPVVILESVDDERELLIWIGFPEAQAIALRLENINTPRPMTHDLLQNILEKSGIKVVKVVISDLKEDIFLATITLEKDRKTMEIDSRPSDAIALAVRADAPIYAASFVLEQARGTGEAFQEAGEKIRRRYGFGAQALNHELAEYFGLPNAEGVLVSDIDGKGVADLAGLNRGDVIIEVDGVKTTNLKDFYDTLVRLEDKKEFSLNVLRDKDKLSLTFRAP